MRIGIDLDNTINVNQTTVNFFSLFTTAISMIEGHEIIIITNRDPGDREETEKELDRYGIYYNHLVLTDRKAECIIKSNISIYFDDTDETFITLPETVTVFKIREPGNFDFTPGVHKWIYGNKTGLNIDDRYKRKQI